jgi:hypothetical protein
MKKVHERLLFATVVGCSLVVATALRVMATSDQGSPQSNNYKDQWSCGVGSQNGDSCTYKNCTGVACWGAAQSNCQESNTCGDEQAGTCHVTVVGGTYLYDCR